MRILHTNKLESATLTATTENYNYPLGNLLVNQLALAYRATDITVDVQAVFDTAQNINAVGVAGHNATKIVVKYYTLSTDVAPVYEKTYNSPLATDVLYSDDYSVEKVVVRFESSVTISVGAMFVGEYYQMPNPTAYYPENYVITNTRTDTAFGAVYGSDGVMLREINPSFIVVSTEQYKSVIGVVKSLRNYRCLFVDMNESNHAYKEPLYGTINMQNYNTSRDARKATRTSFMHSFSLLIREVQ
jgi:hypothetical protein